MKLSCLRGFEAGGDAGALLMARDKDEAVVLLPQLSTPIQEQCDLARH
jgi:hypothetical protein